MRRAEKGREEETDAGLNRLWRSERACNVVLEECEARDGIGVVRREMGVGRRRAIMSPSRRMMRFGESV